MTVREIIENSEPVKDLELFCASRPLAMKRLLSVCEGFKNPKTDNVWVLTATVIQKITDTITNNPSFVPRDIMLDIDLLSDWLIKNLERCRQEKINAGLPVPAR